MTYYRIQDADPKTIFEWKSGDVNPETGEYETGMYDGVCASESLEALLKYFNASDLIELKKMTGNAHIIEFEGKEVDFCYDGVVVKPSKIIKVY